MYISVTTRCNDCCMGVYSSGSSSRMTYSSSRLAIRLGCWWRYSDTSWPLFDPGMLGVWSTIYCRSFSGRRQTVFSSVDSFHEEQMTILASQFSTRESSLSMQSMQNLQSVDGRVRTPSMSRKIILLGFIVELLISQGLRCSGGRYLEPRVFSMKACASSSMVIQKSVWSQSVSQYFCVRRIASWRSFLFTHSPSLLSA